jgi:hypothetical protein
MSERTLHLEIEDRPMIDWNDEDGGAPGGWGGGAEQAREPWLEDADAWRGGTTRDRLRWDPDGDGDERWRGDAHLAEWPVWDAGPEYYMWKRRAEQDLENDED